MNKKQTFILRHLVKNEQAEKQLINYYAELGETVPMHEIMNLNRN